MNRRDVIRRLALGGATIMVMPAVLTSCTKDDGTPDPVVTPGPGPGPGTGGKSIQIDLTQSANMALTSKDGFLITNDIIVINTGSDNFVALSSVCTHNGCTVSYNAGAGNLPCPCHGSIFAMNGSVLNGPAMSSLKTYMVTKSGNTLTIQ